MNRVIFVNNNSNLRVLNDKYVETIRKDVTGGFGKCLKLNKKRDKLFVIQDIFALTVIDLTTDPFNIECTFQVKEEIDHLSDWAIDDKAMIVYFLNNQGSIIICDLKNKSQSIFKIDEKWFMYLVKEERFFNAMALNFNKKLLAVTGVTMFKNKKTNNILVYRIENDYKGNVKLTQISQEASLNNWEGSSHRFTFRQGLHQLHRYEHDY